MLDENDANNIGDGGTLDAEGEGYKCDVPFKDGMKEVDTEAKNFERNWPQIALKMAPSKKFSLNAQPCTTSQCRFTDIWREKISR